LEEENSAMDKISSAAINHKFLSLKNSRAASFPLTYCFTSK
jgi:hypothetical protein